MQVVHDSAVNINFIKTNEEYRGNLKRTKYLKMRGKNRDNTDKLSTDILFFYFISIACQDMVPLLKKNLTKKKI